MNRFNFDENGFDYDAEVPDIRSEWLKIKTYGCGLYEDFSLGEIERWGIKVTTKIGLMKRMILACAALTGLKRVVRSYIKGKDKSDEGQRWKKERIV